MLFAAGLSSLGAPARGKRGAGHSLLSLQAADVSVLSPAQQRTYDFWETRSRNHELGSKEVARAISLHEETGSSEACKTWCYGDVKVSHDGQHAFPPRVTYPSGDGGEIADWIEKCSWDTRVHMMPHLGSAEHPHRLPLKGRAWGSP